MPADHDVDGRVAIEPEQVLEQNRVAAQLRAKDRQLEQLSKMTNRSVIATTGVPRINSRLVAYIAQTNSGNRNQVIPGARIL